MIYALEILNSKFVKIGFTDHDDVSLRIAQLQTGCPFEIRHLFTTYGTLMQEKAIHSSLNVAFGRLRCPIPPNEWYPGRYRFFADFLEYLKYGPDAGLAFSENYNPAIKQQGSFEGAGDFRVRFKWPSPADLDGRKRGWASPKS